MRDQRDQIDQIERQFSGKKDAETLNILLEFYRSLPGAREVDKNLFAKFLELEDERIRQIDGLSDINLYLGNEDFANFLMLSSDEKAKVWLSKVESEVKIRALQSMSVERFPCSQKKD